MKPTEIAGLRPDTAQWVDLRGFLFSGRCDLHTNADPAAGFVVRAWDYAVAFAAGAPSRQVIEAAVSGATDMLGEWHFLAPPESVDAVQGALDGWRRRGVTLHVRADDGPEPAARVLRPGIEIRVADHGWEAAGLDVGHLPPALREEYRTPLVRRRPMAAALAGAEPVAFCYAAVTTETLWDVAVDTLEGWRRQGLAAACFVELERHLKGLGLRPVWGALDDNRASMRLAAGLGFVPEAPLTSFVRPVRGEDHERPQLTAARASRRRRPPGASRSDRRASP